MTNPNETAVAVAAWAILAAAHGLTDDQPDPARTDGRPSAMRDRIDGGDGRLLRAAGHGVLLDRIVAAHRDAIGPGIRELPDLMDRLAALAGVDPQRVRDASLQAAGLPKPVTGWEQLARRLECDIMAHRHEYDLAGLVDDVSIPLGELFSTACGAVQAECQNCTSLLTMLLVANDDAFDAFIGLMQRAWRGSEPTLSMLVTLARTGGDPDRVPPNGFDRILMNTQAPDRRVKLRGTSIVARIEIAEITARLITLSPATRPPRPAQCDTEPS